MFLLLREFLSWMKSNQGSCELEDPEGTQMLEENISLAKIKWNLNSWPISLELGWSFEKEFKHITGQTHCLQLYVHKHIKLDWIA